MHRGVDYLSAGVPPRLILASAARKLWRAARDRVAWEATWPARDEILRGFQASTPDQLAVRLQGTGRGLVAPDRGGIAGALASLFPDEAAAVVQRAVKAACGRLVVFGREIDVRRVGGGTDWRRASLGSRPLAGEPTGEPRPAQPCADVKVSWSVGRGEQWVALGCGALAEPARSAALAEAFAASLRDFVEQNPLGRGVQWASPMEASLRAVCLGQAHAMLSGAPALADPRYALDVAGLAVATGRFVLSRLEDAQVVPNNHLAANWLGLLACAALVPTWPEATRWRQLGVAGLVRELEAQTHEEGTTFEGSVPYHRLAIEIFTAGALLARELRAPLPGAFWRRLAGMYAVARCLLSSAGELPQIGDNDSGRVLAFRPRASLDASYLLPLGAVVVGEPRLRTRPGFEGAEEALWVAGPAAVEKLREAAPGPPARSESFPRGGFHVLRRGGIEVAISCGRNGQRGVGGHSHNDKLAFELRFAGRLVVCDPGSPSYTGDPELRERFRSTRVHATVVVDGREQAPIPPGRPFALPDSARATCLDFGSPCGHPRFVGEHRGYARGGVVHRRAIELLGDAVRVHDRLEGTGAHAVELRFPFPDVEARTRPPTASELGRLEALGAPALPSGSRAVEIGPPSAPLALVVLVSRAAIPPRLESALYSPGYAEIVPASAAVFAGVLVCPAALTTYILRLTDAGAR